VWLNYAYEISNGNIDFLKTLKAENGQMKLDLQSFVPIKWWGREESFWLCQIYQNYEDHRNFKNSEAFKKWYIQIHYCRDIRVDAIEKKRLKTTFYWYSARNKAWVDIVKVQ
jgi:hypothetical protein